MVYAKIKKEGDINVIHFYGSDFKMSSRVNKKKLLEICKHNSHILRKKEDFHFCDILIYSKKYYRGEDVTIGLELSECHAILAFLDYTPISETFFYKSH